jgi:hypothetical protein
MRYDGIATNQIRRRRPETVFENFVPAVSAIVGVAAGFLFGIIKDHIQRKADAEERFFYEVYPKRLAVYEDVFRFFSKTADRKITLNGPPVSSDEIYGTVHDLKSLLVRIALFGSLASREPLDFLLEKLVAVYNNVTAGLAGDGAGNFIALVNQALGRFTVVVTEETGSLRIDEKLAEMNARKTKRNKPIKKHIKSLKS